MRVLSVKNDLFIEYLDDVYGEEKLFDTNPMKRAVQKLFVQDFEKKVSTNIKYYGQILIYNAS